MAEKKRAYIGIYDCLHCTLVDAIVMWGQSRAAKPCIRAATRAIAKTLAGAIAAAPAPMRARLINQTVDSLADQVLEAVRQIAAEEAGGGASAEIINFTKPHGA